MKSKLSIIKVGGKVVENEEALQQVVSSLSSFSHPHILVHGGGNLASDLMQKLGYVPQFHEGRRITDQNALDIGIMVYAGLINKNIVARYNTVSTLRKALGCCGADLELISSHLRSKEPLDYGFVGDLHDDSVNIKTLDFFLRNNITPIFSAITATPYGQLLNTNADTIASQLAMSMSSLFEVELVYLFEYKGVLKNINDLDSVITSINKQNYAELKIQRIVSDGMIPKIDNAFKAIDKGVKKVVIGHHQDLGAHPHYGTTITA